MARRLALLLVCALVGCDDGGADPLLDASPVGESDAGLDAAVDAAPEGPPTPTEGTWLLTVAFGDLELALSFEVDVAVDAGALSFTLRALNGAGMLSGDLATVSDVAVDEAGGFTARFVEFLLPEGFSPVGDVTVTVVLEGTVRAADFICGTARGEAVSLMLDLGVGAFGAVPKGQGAPPASCDGEGPGDDALTLGEDRPARIFLPAAYADTMEPWPLVVLLHGRGSSGLQQDTYLGVSARRDAEGFIALAPDGLEDPQGSRYWNATPACCDDFGSGVDDVAYLTGLIERAQAEYRIDPARIYLMGHSNGGYMSYRLACEIGDRVAGVVVLAGSSFLDAADCGSMTPISVLHVHARDDDTVAYAGDPDPDPADGYPGAEETAQRWATRAGCGDATPGERLDLVPSVEGAETEVTTWPGCRGVAVELWSLDEGGHIPAFGGRWVETALPWLLAR